MTLRGLFVTVFGIFSMIVALGTEIKEFYIMALCICGLVAYSLLSIILASLTLNVDSKVNRASALRGEEVKYDLSFNGFIILPVAGYLSVKAADLQTRQTKRMKHTFLMMTSVYINRKFSFELPCKHIGSWEVGIRKLRFEDLFGLFSLPLIRSKKSDLTSRLDVMSRYYLIEDAQESTSSGGFGNTSSANAEEGELLGDSRIYREGDSLKRINWKQSTRAKKLYSRQYEMLQKPKIAVVVDMAFGSKQMLNASDIAFETALTLTNFFVENSNNVDIMALRLKSDENTKVFEIKTHNDVVTMQYNFASVPFGKAEEPLRLDMIENTRFLEADKIYFITDTFEDSLIKELKDINKNGKFLRCIIPRVDLLEENSDTQEDESMIAYISTTEEISKKVGAVL